MSGFFDDQLFRVTGQALSLSWDALDEYQNLPTLVCGGRGYTDRRRVFRVLEYLNPSIVIEGGAQGADRIARKWAQMCHIHVATVHAYWDHYGRAAGRRRNTAMALLWPRVIVAFPGGTGTRNMCEQASCPVVSVLGDESA